ncbi:MAG: LacI family DNA-binding transcriptional regulator, partial [Puniceicoccales bacterium]
MPLDEPNQGRRPTIVDVARTAGVSHMTVSRVLNGAKRVSPDTACRVHEAVKKTGYRPDPVMSALAAYRTRSNRSEVSANLAFLDRDGTPYSASVFDGLRAEATAMGYAVQRHTLPHDARKQLQLSRMLYNRGVRGLLFGP